MIGTIAFAVSGAVLGIEKKMDILGVVVLGEVTSIGGGIIRDLLLGNTPPNAFTHPIYATVALFVSLIMFIPKVRNTFVGKSETFDKIMLIMDSIGLGVFTVVGIHVANGFDSNGFLAVFVGVLTGVGGGLTRDVISDSMPYIFTKHFYCSASIIGALVTVSVNTIYNETAGMIVGTVLIFVLRILAAHFRWKLPRA
ncbi:MAG: TRIC cation channel family protein [Clostridia bacterium]|nr:TRIC cation channel family protein [Clostridia bacterium]